jgi:hypothetical protein
MTARRALTWDYSWWNVRAPWLILLLGYLPFFLVAFWVHDMQSPGKQAMTVGAIYAFEGLCLLVFGPVLGWIWEFDPGDSPAGRQSGLKRRRSLSSCP